MENKKSTTNDRIIAAYWELNEKNKLSVSNICKLAHINRSTFYEYYLDILDLANQEEDHIISELVQQIDTEFPNHIPNDLEDFTKVAINIFTKYSKNIYIILNHNSLNFQNKINELLSKRLTKVLDISPLDPNFKYIMVFIVSNICSIINSWYVNNKDLTVEEIVELIYNLMFKGLLGYKKV